MILAAKAAVAAAVAWYLAPYVPWADNDYSYYAPLGVLVSMYPTVAGSARAGLQSLVGLSIGIGLGLAGLGIVLLGAPAVVAVAVVIAAGIVIGGVTALGVGSDWVAMAGLFVLLLGGTAADEFSLSYLLTMAFGVLIGVVTNLLVFPPLHLRRASARLSALRDATAEALVQIADVLAQNVVSAEEVDKATSDLMPMRQGVADDVGEAQESSRGNPRGRRRRSDRDLITARMSALGVTAQAVRELAEVILRAEADGALPDQDIRMSLADAVRACSELVGAPSDDAKAALKVESTARALDESVGHLNQHPSVPGSADYSPAYAYAAVVCVRSVVDACKEFVDVTNDSASGQPRDE